MQQRTTDLVLEAKPLRGDDHLLALGEDDGTAVTFDFQHGFRECIVAALGRVGGLDDGHRAGGVAHQDRGGVFRPDLRVALLCLARKMRHFAEEIARQVEDVDADVLDDQLFLFRQVGLAAVDVKAGAPGQPRPCRRADGALVEDLLHCAHGGSEAEILMYRQPGVVLSRRLDDGDAVFPCRCKGLLHHGGNAALGGNGGKRLVGVHAGGDVEEVDLHRVEHAAHVGEMRNAVGLSGCGRAGFVTVADGGQDGALRPQVSPRIEMVLGIEAASHHADRHRIPGRHDVPPHLV